MLSGYYTVLCYQCLCLYSMLRCHNYTRMLNLHCHWRVLGLAGEMLVLINKLQLYYWR